MTKEEIDAGVKEAFDFLKSRPKKNKTLGLRYEM